MALGDGIRRNVATISQAERDRLRDAFLKLDMPPNTYPDGVTYWDKQEDIHKNAHEAGQNVHGGPAFLPWHREICNRLEALLRKVDPQLSLHYWDWTTDPRATPDGVGGVINLFSPQFMGSAQGDAGPPLQDFESSENAELHNGHTHVWRNVNGGNPGPPPIPPDQQIVTTGDNAANQDQFELMRVALEQLGHNTAHGYIGGTLAASHYSFHDPFVFLLHSNVDRLWATWQTAPGRAWRLDPNQVYGTDNNAPPIVADLQPWAGDVGTGVPPLSPWVPGSADVLVKNSKDPSVVTPPRYDTISTTTFNQYGHTMLQNADGRLEVFVVGNDGALWHIWQTAPNNGWSNWFSQGMGNSALIGTLAVAQNTDGRLEVYARGSDGALWHIWQTAPNNGWSAWASQGTAGGGTAGSPVMAQNADGRLEVFVVGNDGALWHIWQTAPNNGWSNWFSQGTAGGGLIGTPAIARNADGRLEVYARGNDGALWHIWQTAPNNGWSNWFSQDSAGGGFASTPVMVQNADGRLEVFVVGNDGALWHIWQTAPNNGWSAWASQGTAGNGFAGSPVVAQNADGRLEVYAIGNDGALWHIWQTAPNNGWSVWASQGTTGGGLTNPLGMAQNADGRLEVYARGNDGALWHIWQTAPNNGWSAWASQGSAGGGFAGPALGD